MPQVGLKPDLTGLSPASFEEDRPSGRRSRYLPGRIFKLDGYFKKAGISFETDIPTMSNALAILTSTKIDEEGGIHHSCSCNGPHHAVIVEKFSYLVASEMLTPRDEK